MFDHARKISLALSLGLVACGGATSSRWDPQASTSLRAQPAMMLQDLDSGNFDRIIATADDDSVVLDFDENNNPVRAEGRAKVTQFFRGLEAESKAHGLRFKSTISRTDCSATAQIGYCVVEFDQTITAGGKTMGPFKFRATVVSRKVGDAWQWSHWHGSFRESPPAAPSPPATSAAR